MIFVDFDDTICLHKQTINSKDFITDYPYKNSISNYKLIRWLYNEKARTKQSLILLTKASSFMLKHKVDWCNKECPELFDDFVALSTDCSKKEYIEKFNGKHVFIDDNYTERQEVLQLENVKVFSPQYLMCI